MFVNPEDDPPGSAYDFLLRLILPPRERIDVEEVLAAIQDFRTKIEQVLSEFVNTVEGLLSGDGGATSEQDTVTEDVSENAGQSDGTE